MTPASSKALLMNSILRRRVFRESAVLLEISDNKVHLFLVLFQKDNRTVMPSAFPDLSDYLVHGAMPVERYDYQFRFSMNLIQTLNLCNLIPVF